MVRQNGKLLLYRPMMFSLAEVFRNLARTRMNPWNIANSADSTSKILNEQFPVHVITIVKEVQY